MKIFLSSFIFIIFTLHIKSSHDLHQVKSDCKEISFKTKNLNLKLSKLREKQNETLIIASDWKGVKNKTRIGASVKIDRLQLLSSRLFTNNLYGKDDYLLLCIKYGGGYFKSKGKLYYKHNIMRLHLSSGKLIRIERAEMAPSKNKWLLNNTVFKDGAAQEGYSDDNNGYTDAITNPYEYK